MGAQISHSVSPLPINLPPSIRQLKKKRVADDLSGLLISKTQKNEKEKNF
jgi:hypothetical protein